MKQASVHRLETSLLVVSQLLRTAMADATGTQSGIDPDRANFSIALQAARTRSP